jgi:CBS domain containing-hemolysin-like protein
MAGTPPGRRQQQKASAETVATEVAIVFPAISGETWPEIAALVVALALFMLATTAESSVILLSRTRVWSLVGRNVPHAQALQRYVEERHLLHSVLSLVRSLSVVTATALVVYILIREFGATWTVLITAIVVAVICLAELEALTRVLVAVGPERASLVLSPAIWLFRFLFSLPARVLEAPGRLLLRLRGVKGYPPEELAEDSDLLRLVELQQSDGGFEEEERQMIRAIVELEDTTVREIMVPRLDIVAVDEDTSFDEVVQIIIERGFSRIPVYAETIDNILGIIYAKDLLPYLSRGTRPPNLRSLARPPYFIPESKRVDELLSEMRQSKVHMAVVVDEYGGTAGLVTIEDLLEEIVGEIEDEHDVAQVTLERVSEDEAILDARIGIDQLNDLFDLQIESEDFDTVGGLVYHELGKMPSVGDEVRTSGLRLQVLSVTGNRIKKVRVVREPAAPASPQPPVESPQTK